MDLRLLTWSFVLFVMLWRFLMVNYTIQARLHKWKLFGVCLAPWLQWYSIFFVGCFCILFRTACLVLLRYGRMGADEIRSNLVNIWKSDHTDLTPDDDITSPDFKEFTEEFEIPLWLGWVSGLSIVAGFLTFIVAAMHVRHFAVRGKEEAERCELNYVREAMWKPASRENMMLMVITLPVVFGALALHASCGLWRMMTGSTSLDDSLAPGTSLATQITLELTKCQGHLALGAACQYYTIWSFIRLCGSFLNSDLNALMEVMQNSSDNQVRLYASQFDAREYKRSLNWAAFLAVHAFVFVGVIKSVLELLIVESDEIGIQINDTANSALNAVFLGMTVLCIINMLIVGNMRAITRKLGNANMKFLGTRALLIIAQVQVQVLEMCTKDSRLHRVVEQHLKAFGINEHPLGGWAFSKYSALLMHTSLVSFECLFVVVTNQYTWKNKDMERNLFLFGFDVGHEFFLQDVAKYLEHADSFRSLGRIFSDSSVEGGYRRI